MIGAGRRLLFGFRQHNGNAPQPTGREWSLDDEICPHYDRLPYEISSEFPGFRQFSSQPLLICPVHDCLLQNRAVDDQLTPVKFAGPRVVRLLQFGPVDHKEGPLCVVNSG